MAGGRHPVRRELDVTQRVNAGCREIGDGLADGHPAGRGAIDQCKRRALAHRHCLARIALEVHQRDRDIGNRHLPRSNHRIARAHAAHGAIADRDEERLVRHRRKLQHAVDGILQRDVRKVERRQRARAVPDVTRHLGRLAEDHVERHVHGIVRKVRIAHDQLSLRIRRADDGVRAALARADGCERGLRLRRDGQHVALLRLVAPDLARRHAGLLRWMARRSNVPPAPPAVHELRQRVGQAASADVVQRKKWDCRDPRCQQRSITSCARRSISALPRCTESKSRSAVLTPVAIDDAAPPPMPMSMPGPPSWDEQRSGRQRVLVRVLVADVADAAGDHDRLVIAAHLARDGLLDVRKYPARFGRPNSLLNDAAPMGPSSMIDSAEAMRSGLP